MEGPETAAFDAALWLVRHLRAPLGLSLQEFFEWLAAAAALVNERLRAGRDIVIIKQAGLFGDANGLLAELAVTMRSDLHKIVQALPGGFQLEVSGSQALVQWFDLGTGKTICLDNAVAVRPE